MIDILKKLKKFKRPTIYICLIIFSFFIMSRAQAANDAIGVMVYSNKNHYSPSKWYQEEVENPDAPSLIQIDGYEAVVDGRTVYVAATNQGSSTYYTNIYLISYNDNANSATVEIFNQLLDNWHFNTDITSTSTKAKITRDTKRLADLQNLADLINSYGAANNNIYPQLTAGTFVRGQSSSKWPSWNQTLGAALGATLPQDPTNEFTGCTAIPEPTTSGYDYPETCWNESNNDFSCTDNTLMYFYNNFYTGNTNNYNVTALTEIISNGNLGFYSTLDTAHINLEGMITNAGSLVPMCEGGGLGAFCGNGQIDPGEDCELGDTRDYCEYSSSCGQYLPGGKDWHLQNFIGCTNECEFYDPYPDNGTPPPEPTTTQCTGYCGGYCGDNLRQGQFGEECDGTSFGQFAPGYTCLYNGISNPLLLQCNGSCYLNCSSGILVPVTTSCGNGLLEYPEQCDWQSYQDPTRQYSSVDNQYDCKTSGTYACKFQYNSTTYYGYCGDDIIQNGVIAPYVNEGEQCDGSTGITTPQVWNCTENGNISCPEAPDPNACLRICDTGCPYQGECGDNIWQNTGSCHEGCENDNSGKTPPNTDCNNTPPTQPPTCTVNGCVSMWQACDGSWNDADGCETPLGTMLNCLGCGDDCNVGVIQNGTGICNIDPYDPSNSGCRIQCNADYHCSSDTWPYQPNSVPCPQGDTCVFNCGDFYRSGSEICDDGAQGTVGPPPDNNPGKNGLQGHCNMTCDGYVGFGTALFTENFEYNLPGGQNIYGQTFTQNWQVGSYGVNTSWSIQDYPSNLSPDNHILRGTDQNDSDFFIRDIMCINPTVANITNFSVLVGMDLSLSLTNNTMILGRRKDYGTNFLWQNQIWYNFWSNFTAAGLVHNDIRRKLQTDNQWGVQLAQNGPPSTISNTEAYIFLFDLQTMPTTASSCPGHTRIRVKWWLDGDDPPGYWTITTCDNSISEIIGPGRIALGIWRYSTTYFDNFIVYPPQP